MRGYAVQILTGLTGSLVAAALFSLWAGLFRSPERSALALMLAVGVVVVGVVATVGIARMLEAQIRRVIEPRVADAIRPEIEKSIRAELARRTGIIELFDRFSACEQEILEALGRAHKVKVFLQIGKTVLSGATTFYDYLGDAKFAEGAHIQILRASIDNPYLAERVAHARKSKYDEWRDDLDNAERKVQTLVRLAAPRLEARQHKEGYVWRMFIFDSVAYVQPYLFSRQNSENATVLKINRCLSDSAEANALSLYGVFERYFDHKWDECRPEAASLDELIPPDDQSAVAAVCRYHQFFVFAVPRRYVEKDSRELLFHGIGGKRHPGETWTAALTRECFEETGESLTIRAAAKTRYVTTGASLDPVEIADSPKPYCVYRRRTGEDPNFVHEDVLWLVGYEATLNADRFAEPRSETAIILYLTGDLLRRTLQEKVTYAQIRDSQDGSRVVPAPGMNMDYSRYAVPAGLAILVAAEQRPRLSRRL